ncbi:transcriptional regulator containing PAS AAA-type ATPase and DNA-binding domains-like protein [Clostridium sp. CAG:253]|nr:transcriptional regulator containing PAS AAA-type ATPase and DNA-binding domains-like protein [Clostridium sp. CAG:253]
MGEERYEYIGRILESIHPSVTIADGKGRFVYLGKAFKEFAGKGEMAERIKGMYANNPTVLELFKPCVTQLVLESGKKVTTTQKNLQNKEVFVTGIPIFDNEKKLDMIICFSSWDISNSEELKVHFEELRKENSDLINEIKRLTKGELTLNSFIGSSRNVQNALRLLKIFSKQNVPAFVHGPTGCGKGYLCRMAYEQDGAVYEYNCKLISEENLEIELFGDSEKGGILDFIGYRAIILGDVEVLSPKLQKKLVAKLKTEDKLCIGLSEYSLEELKDNQKITDEFYYYYKSYQVEVLPINERPEDLQAFIEYYLEHYNKKYGRKIDFSPKALNCLLNYEWKENIIEIRYTIERLVLTAEENIIEVYNLPEKMTEKSAQLFLEDTCLKDMMELYEKGIICRAYEKYHTTVEVAKKLGISQASAVRKIGKYVTER